MKTIYNNYLPLKGFVALTIFPFVFVRNDKKKLYGVRTQRHEKIHAEQQKEMLVVFFYLWYFIEWLIKLVYYRNKMTAYYNISFEREAFGHESNVLYPESREHFSWLNYIRV